MSWASYKTDSFSSGAALSANADRPVRVNTLGKNAHGIVRKSYTGYVRCVDNNTLILDHPRGGEFVIPTATVVAVYPLREGAKL